MPAPAAKNELSAPTLPPVFLTSCVVRAVAGLTGFDDRAKAVIDLRALRVSLSGSPCAVWSILFAFEKGLLLRDSRPTLYCRDAAERLDRNKEALFNFSLQAVYFANLKSDQLNYCYILFLMSRVSFRQTDLSLIYPAGP